MKILICYSYFCTTKGYWGTRVYENAKRWVAAGHTIKVITAPYEKSDMPKTRGEYDFEGIAVVIEPFADNNRAGTFQRGVNAVRFMMACVKQVLKGDQDVVISSSGPLSLGIPLIVAKKWKKNETVFEVRDLWPDVPIALGKLRSPILQRIAKWLEKKIYRNADLIVTASPGQLEHIKSHNEMLNIHCISNASDNQLFSTQSVNIVPPDLEGNKLILHIGSLGFIHNCSYWLEVMKDINDKDIQLIFIGDGAEREMLERKARIENIDNVRFEGLKPKEELIHWLATSKATVFSTIPDPMQETCSPNKVFDSFAAGLPVIQTTKGWIGELIEEEKAGINVDPHNPASTAKEIEELLNDPKRLTEMGAAAKRLAHTQFDRDKLAQTYLEILEELVEK